MTDPFTAGELDAPIQIHAGNPVIDGGIAAVPKMLLRFACYLDCDGEQLTDRQILLLAMVIGLHEDRSLRLSNLPMTASIKTLAADLRLFRKVGLVFTRREYYPAVSNRPPRMRAQTWDIRALLSNLDSVQRLWLTRQAQKLGEWRTGGGRGPKPVYVFPADYRHPVSVPTEVLENIAADAESFYPVPDRWLQLIGEMFTPEQIAALKNTRHLPTVPKTDSRLLPTVPNTAGRAFPANFQAARPGFPPDFGATANPEGPTVRKTDGRDAPTVPNTAGRAVPTASKTDSHLVKDSEEEEGLVPEEFPDDPVVARFVALKGNGYQFTERDREQLAALRADGYTDDEIQRGIDAAFALPSKPQRFVQCARVTRNQPPATGKPEPQPPANRKVENQKPELLPELTDAAALIESIDDNSPSPLAKLKALADGCDAVARKHNSTGPAWTLRAIRLSVQAKDPLAYAKAVLDDWIENGPELRSRERRQKAPVAVRKTDWNKSIDA